MSLIVREPFYSVDDMFKGLPALFGRVSPFSGCANTDWSPSVDISESGEEYLIRAALPAVKKEEQNGEKFHKVESFHGNFSRAFALPEGQGPMTIGIEGRPRR